MKYKREILFRAWYEAGKEMIHNPAFGGGFNSNYMCDVNDNDEGFKDPDLIWLQYTGLKDKGGVKVFDGDIVEADWFFRVTAKWEIAAEGPCYIIKCISLFKKEAVLQRDDSNRMRVIGNIYENPELIQ